MSVASWQIVGSASGFWPLAIFAPLYLYALLRGDSSARGYAGAFAVAAILGTILATISPGPMKIGPALLSLDTMLLAAHVMLCLRSKWLYPIVIAAMQLLAVMIEGFSAAGLAGRPAAATALLVVLASAQFACFVFGVIAHRSRRSFWRVRRRPENPTSDLAPRANGAR
jgi:hypothetical protein